MDTFSGTFLGNMFFQQIPNDTTTNVSVLFLNPSGRGEFVLLKMTTTNLLNGFSRQKRLGPCRSRFVIKSILIFVVATLILSAEASKELKSKHFPKEQHQLSLEELSSERGKRFCFFRFRRKIDLVHLYTRLWQAETYLVYDIFKYWNIISILGLILLYVLILLNYSPIFYHSVNKKWTCIS